MVSGIENGGGISTRFHNVNFFRDKYFHVGDFDGDGKDELLGDNKFGKTATLFAYENNDFVPIWSNNGNQSHGIHPYQGNFVVGDFDNDGKDELLGDDLDGWTTMFKFNNSDFVWVWSDNGNHGIRPYKGNFISGDFDGDGKFELLGNDLDGWTTMFKFNNGDFDWMWSDNGNHGIQPYKGKLVKGNYDEDKADELLGIYTWATKFDFGNNDFNWSWSTGQSQRLSDHSIKFLDNHIFFKSNYGPDYLLIINHLSLTASIYTFHD